MKISEKSLPNFVAYIIAIVFAMFFFIYIRDHGEYLFLDNKLSNKFFDYDEFIGFHFIVLFFIQTVMILVKKRNSLERVIVNMYGVVLVFMTSFYHFGYQNLFEENRRIYIFGNYLVSGIPTLLILVLIFYTVINIILLGKKPKLHIFILAVITLLGYFIVFDFLTRI